MLAGTFIYSPTVRPSAGPRISELPHVAVDLHHPHIQENSFGDGAMKVFISSLIGGFEAERAAVKDAIETPGHDAITAETFSARAASPQVACLQGLREADLVVLVLGLRYGAVQPSGISATHEEFREARGRKPVLVFLQTGDAEAAQAAFIEEVSGWQGGQLRAPFATPEELRRQAARALHDYELAHAVAPVDPEKLRARVLELLPDVRLETSNGMLSLAIAAGPTQPVLRPAEIETTALSDALQQQALFGVPPLFERKLGTLAELQRGVLVVHQEQRQGLGASVRLWETGDIIIQLPSGRRTREQSLPAIIEEDVASDLHAAIGYAAWLLQHIDPTEKLTHVALAAQLTGGGYFGWRTRAEHEASPRTGSMSGFGREQERGAAVVLTPAHRVRQALAMDAQRLVEDLLVLLRRQWSGV
jgi:hypothetical protein